MNVRSGHSIGLAPFTPEGKDFCAVSSPLHLGQGLGVGQQKITRPHLVIFYGHFYKSLYRDLIFMRSGF